jgi:hypothetical protein
LITAIQLSPQPFFYDNKVTRLDIRGVRFSASQRLSGFVFFPFYRKGAEGFLLIIKKRKKMMRILLLFGLPKF